MSFSRNSYYCDFRIPSLSAQQGILYRAYRSWYLLFQPLTVFVWCRCPCRPLIGCQWFSHHYLTVLAVPLPSTKQRRLFCLFACCGFFYPLQCVCSLSLSLTACTWWFQLILASFGWYVIPTGHFPQKSLSKNPIIGFFSLPTTRPCSLTHNPPLPILVGYRLVVPRSRAYFTFFTRCSCTCHVLEIVLYALPCTFGFLWCGLFSDLPFLMTCFFWGLGLIGSWAFLPPAYFVFTPWPCSHAPTVPLCYSCYNVVWLNPAGPLWACCLFPSQWLSVFTRPFLTLFAGSCV